jgi:hypothetical protein
MLKLVAQKWDMRNMVSEAADSARLSHATLRGALRECNAASPSMEEVATGFLKILVAYQHAAFVIVYTSWEPEATEMFRRAGVLRNERVYLATSDHYFAKHWHKLKSPLRTVLMPYRANYLLDGSKVQAIGTRRRKGGWGKPVAFFFAGNLQRRDRGAMRAGAILPMESKPNGLIVNSGSVDAVSRRQVYKESEWMKLLGNMIHETTENFLSSNTCLHPVGDTPTARRLFEAVAAGCVPIAMGDPTPIIENLPFQRSVNWLKLLLFAGSLECLAANDGAQSKALAAFLTTHAGTIREVVGGSADSQRVYRDHMSYTRPGIVNSVMEEVMHRQDIHAQLKIVSNNTTWRHEHNTTSLGEAAATADMLQIKAKVAADKLSGITTRAHLATVDIAPLRDNRIWEEGTAVVLVNGKQLQVVTAAEYARCAQLAHDAAAAARGARIHSNRAGLAHWTDWRGWHVMSERW